MTFDSSRTAKQRRRLIALLESLFQLDQPDLDFGFYKIMHAKAGSVSEFLQKDLLKIIQDTFGEVDEEKIERLRLRYEHAVEQAQSYDVPDPEATKPVQKAKAVYDAARDSDANEGDIYDHLYRFFERYYDNGDFMSRRYFARETGSKAAPYAVPYDGREVYLHWANRDQYYIKTSEHLKNFTFDIAKHWKSKEERVLNNIPESLQLRCRIVEASEGEHNNNKATNGTERFFIIHADQPAVIENGELALQFEYRPDKERLGAAAKWQERRIDEAEGAILHAVAGMGEAYSYSIALRREIGQDDNDHQSRRTLLRKYLNQYTKRNSSDYFIHKDLGSFLRRELDFYIKNEIMRLDNIESADAPQVEIYLDKIKALRKIAGQLITFLAQIEEFQKKLWLKKKFVTETQYCITLDRIPEALYADIAANEAQRQEWVKLFAIDQIQGDLTTPAYSEPLTADFLKANPFLVLDTAFFSERFKDALIAGIEDLDENLDGLLIHSENFQALGLMQEKYQEQVKCIYIDPPYNTGNGGFIYKDSYQHSGWLSMMENRLIEARGKIGDDGVIFISIDDTEQSRLKELCDTIFGAENYLGTIEWNSTKSVTNTALLSNSHTHNFAYAKNLRYFIQNRTHFRLPDSKDGFSNPDNDPRGEWKADPFQVGGERPNQLYEIINPNTGIVYKPNPGSSWKNDYEKYQELIADNRIVFGVGGESGPQRKRFWLEAKERGKVAKSWWDDVGTTANATQQTKNMFGDGAFPNPKPVDLLERFLKLGLYQNRQTTLDYFAGSGTTGHAVVNLNREDGGKRKYIMVEMGTYFDTVLKPRMQKVVYSQDWKEGKPVSRDGMSHSGISHAFKYIRLESYEDTLNNLSFRDDEQAKARQDAINHPDNKKFKREYMLRYWLEFETKGSPSLLNIEQLDDPTAYMLTLKRPGSDAYQEKAVDLVESFNWLIGLHVDHLDKWRSYSASFKREPDPELPGDDATRLILNGPMNEAEGVSDDGKWLFRKIKGRICRTPGDMNSADRVLVIWRRLTGNLEEDNAMLDEFFRRHYPALEERQFDIIYINGSNSLQQLCQDDEHWQVRLIEEAFHQQMWEVEG